MKRAFQQRRRNKRNLKGDKIEQNAQKSEVKRRSDRAKVLTNNGELSKAFAMMVQRGVAPSTGNIIAQLTKKFPKRKRMVRWPSKDRIDELRNILEKTVIDMDVEEHIEEEAPPQIGVQNRSLAHQQPRIQPLRSSVNFPASSSLSCFKQFHLS